MNAPKEEKKQPSEAAAPAAQEIVKLNVGGKSFITSRATLKLIGSPVLDRMLDGHFATPADGVWFLDMAPEPFELILNTARYGRAFPLGQSPFARELQSAVLCLLQIEPTRVLPAEQTNISKHKFLDVRENAYCLSCHRSAYCRRRTLEVPLP
jgi:hypothetical protein